MQGLKKILTSKTFAPTMYEIFFILSPTSKPKFRNIHRQGTVYVEMCRMLLKDSMSGNLRTRMETAHEKHNVTKKEYKKMMLAFKSTYIAYCVNNGKLDYNEGIALLDERFVRMRSIINLADNDDISDSI